MKKIHSVLWRLTLGRVIVLDGFLDEQTLRLKDEGRGEGKHIMPSLGRWQDKGNPIYCGPTVLKMARGQLH